MRKTSCWWYFWKEEIKCSRAALNAGFCVFSQNCFKNGFPMLSLSQCAAMWNREVCITFMMSIWMHLDPWMSSLWPPQHLTQCDVGRNPITSLAGVFSPCSAWRLSRASMQPGDRLPPSHDLARPPLLLLTDFIYFLLFSSPGHRHPLLPWFQLKQELVWGCRVMFVHFKHPFSRLPLFNVPVCHPTSFLM